MQTKVCSVCRKEKPLRPGFNRRKASKDGYNTRCAQCVRDSRQRCAEMKTKSSSNVDPFEKGWI